MKFKCCLLAVAALYFASCESPEKNESTGEQLAKKYCGSCHIFPDPSLLSKNVWKEKILPPMGSLLGMGYYMGKPIATPKSSMSPAEWEQISQYYDEASPDSMPAQERQPISEFTNLFSVRSIDVAKDKFPATSFVKFDEGNHFIYAGDAFDSSLHVYDHNLKSLSIANIHSVLVDMDFNAPLISPGDRSGILTDIGMMNPNDFKKGKADSFFITRKGELTHLSKIIDSLPRPVQTIAVDLDNKGKKDYIVCGFGNINGALYRIKKQKDGTTEREILRALPGAIKAYVEDFNHDGLLDIILLMAQAQEGIFLLTNKGNGSFETKELLRFPPIYGSSYFEMHDFNGDGFKDILYTCGDNGDYTRGVLKYYHGIYIFLNDGKNNFTQKYFFPMHGCYKAIARDFDKDGDLDIAAISFFPDEKNQPQESFVYLEQKKPFQFAPYTIKEFANGNWLTMDAGDVDGDGDDDIVLGSLVPPYQFMQEKWHREGSHKVSIQLLENKTK